VKNGMRKELLQQPGYGCPDGAASNVREYAGEVAVPPLAPR
jgi:hypothetical protein